DLDLVLLLARRPRLSRLLVLELAVVHDADDRRPRRRRDFHEVEAIALCCRERLLHRHDPQLLSVRCDDADRADPDLPVDANSTLRRYGDPPWKSERTRWPNGSGTHHEPAWPHAAPGIVWFRTRRYRRSGPKGGGDTRPLTWLKCRPAT